ncbi:hypothetical protein D3C84_443790 [compost metagenome]
MLADQRQGRGDADDAEHEEQALGMGHLQVAAKAADDGGDAHEAAVGIERGDGHLAERHAEEQQASHHTAGAQPDYVGDLVAGERIAGQRGGEYAEHHGGLRADDRAQAHGEECPEGRCAAWQVARVVRHVGTERDLPRRRQGDRQEEGAPAEVTVVQQGADIVDR